MERLPNPLIVLINSVIDEYDNFTWNSHCFGDKMRISLVWTRGEAVQASKGIKHKSRSSKMRDSKRLKIWEENNLATNIEDSVTVNDENDNVEILTSESESGIE